MELTTRSPLQLQHPVARPGNEALCVELDQPVTAIAVSAQGLVALGTHQGLISIRDAHTGLERHTLRGHRQRVHALAFSPDGETLFSVSRDGGVCRWSMSLGCGEQMWCGLQSQNTCAASGARLLVGGDDGVIRCWTGDRLDCELHGHQGMITTVSLLPGGDLAVSGGVDGIVILWDLLQSEGRTLYQHKGAITCSALSADGALLVSGSTDGSLSVWDLKRERVIGMMSGHDGPVTSCALSADGRRLVSGSSDRAVMVWSLESGQQTHVFHAHECEVLAVAWSAGRAWSASADHSVRAWDLSRQPTPPAHRLRHTAGVTDSALTPDGQLLVSTSLDCTVRIWDTASGTAIQTLRGHKDAIRSVACAPSGGGLASVSEDGEIRLWSRGAGQWLAGPVLAAGQGALSRCRFLGDSMLLTMGQGGTVRAWSILSGRALFDIQAHDGAVRACDLLPDGRIVTAGHSELAIWSAGALQHRLTSSGAPITDCVAHPDGRQVLFSCEDGAVRRWVLGETEPAVLYHHEGAATALAVTPAQILVSVGLCGGLRLHDLQTGATEETALPQPLSTVSAHGGWIVAGDQAGNLWVFARRS